MLLLLRHVAAIACAIRGCRHADTAFLRHIYFFLPRYMFTRAAAAAATLMPCLRMPLADYCLRFARVIFLSPLFTPP